MRILSVGVPLPGTNVDNYSFAAAPAFFDYDGLVIDPAECASDQETVTPGDLRRDRRDETARLLARGSLVVCYARPDGGRYAWLPSPDGRAYDPSFLRIGSGTEIDIADHGHPFAAFIERFAGKMAYEAYFADDAPGFEGRVFARSVGGAAVGVELRVGGGRVVFLPPPARAPAGDDRYAYSNALQGSIRQTLRSAAETDPPRWIDESTLPGLAERLSARDNARGNLVDAQQALGRAEDAARELERFRRLLWQEGKYGLEQVVRDALALIGFAVMPNNLDRPATLSLQGATVLLEVDAAVQAVDLDGHERLCRRLEEAAVRAGPRRGLLVINGYRTLPPERRGAQCGDGLREAAERTGYAIATTEQIYHAVRAALEGDEATMRSFRERLLTTNGALGED